MSDIQYWGYQTTINMINAGLSFQFKIGDRRLNPTTGIEEYWTGSSFTAEGGASGGAIAGVADWTVWSPDGINVNGQNGQTGVITYTGTDWAVIVNQIIAGDPNAQIISIDPRVPNSTSTISLNRPRLSLLIDKTQGRAGVGIDPYCRKIIIDATSQKIKDIMIRGILMDELLFNTGANTINTVTIQDCTMQYYNTTDRNAIRFVDGGVNSTYSQYINFYNCRIYAQASGPASGGWMVNFEGSSDSTGHINFWGCVFESSDVTGFSNIEFVRYDVSGHTGPHVAFWGCSFIRIGSSTSLGGMLLHDHSTSQNGGPRKLLFNNPHLEFYQGGNMSPLVQIESAGANAKYFYVSILDAGLTLNPANTYTWINNLHAGSFIFSLGNGLFISGYQVTGRSDSTAITAGTPATSSTFRFVSQDYGVSTTQMPNYIAYKAGTSTTSVLDVRAGNLLVSSQDTTTALQTTLNVTGPKVIYIADDVPLSTLTTLTINQSDQQLICYEQQDTSLTVPRIRKLTITTQAATDTKRIRIQGLIFDEVFFNSANTGAAIQWITFDGCNFNNYAVTDRQGLRFVQTSGGDIKNIQFLNCSARMQANGAQWMRFEGSSGVGGSTGNIDFINCGFENVGGFTGCDGIFLNTDTLVHAPVTFYSCIFNWSGASTTNTWIHSLCNAANEGAKSLTFTDCYWGLSSATLAAFTFVSIDANNLNNEYLSIQINNPTIAANAANTYTWITNNTTGGFFQESGLRILGGHQLGSSTVFTLGTPAQVANFVVLIENYVGYADQGVAAITVGASPFTYQNLDGVKEAIYITPGVGGTISQIAKNSVNLLNANLAGIATVWLDPFESVVVTYATATAVMNKDRK